MALPRVKLPQFTRKDEQTKTNQLEGDKNGENVPGRVILRHPLIFLVQSVEYIIED